MTLESASRTTDVFDFFFYGRKMSSDKQLHTLSRNFLQKMELTVLNKTGQQEVWIGILYKIDG